MKNRLFILIFSVAFFGSAALAQTLNTAKLDSLFNTLAENNRAMGSVAISKNGVILYTKAIGYSYINDGKKVPATTQTKYRIGSITKMFTATMIFQLIEEGKLSLTTTLDKYFPNVPNAKTITIGNMLSHRSGIYNLTADPDFTAWMVKPKTKQELLDMIAKSKPDFAPDEKTGYSNTNYLLLGYIIETISGMPYKEALKERITSKLGLTNTYAGGKIDVKNNESYSYMYANGWEPETETDMSIPGGAGVIESTPADLVQYITALFDGKLVSQSSLDKMKAITDGIGMGLIQMPYYSRKALGHNGGIDGFMSDLYYFTDDSAAVAYCSNGQVYRLNDIMQGVLNIYYNKKYEIPTFRNFNVTSADLDKYVGVYSSARLPLKITVTKEGNSLMAQATGQSAFPLEATDKDQFKYEQAGVVIQFNPEKNELLLQQGGGQYSFTKEK
jgi:D-alanyl-D-alanine carboxypeptidase